MIDQAKTEYISPKQAADELQVAPRTIMRWIGEGRLAAIKIGPRVTRIKLADWEVFKAQAATPVPEIPRQAPAPELEIITQLKADISKIAANSLADLDAPNPSPEPVELDPVPGSEPSVPIESIASATVPDEPAPPSPVPERGEDAAPVLGVTMPATVEPATVSATDPVPAAVTSDTPA